MLSPAFESLPGQFAYYRHAQVAPVVVAKVREYEERFVAAVAENDQRAVELWEAGNQSEAVEFLTATAEERGNGLVSDWLAFYQQLFMDFRDGQVPDGVASGYAQDWYDRIAEETGDKYLVPESRWGALDEHKVEVLRRYRRYRRFGNAAAGAAGLAHAEE